MHRLLTAESSLPDASAAPSFWVTPLVLDFGPVGVGDMSDPLLVVIANTGNQ